MNNKGFTLIELLATIAILGVVAMISFVSVTAIIKSNKKDQCENIIESIKMASIEYVSDNRYNSSFLGNVLEQDSNKYVEIDGGTRTLLAGRYLNKEIINPFTKDNVTNSIRITINLKDDYTVNTVSVTGMDCNG